MHPSCSVSGRTQVTVIHDGEGRALSLFPLAELAICDSGVFAEKCLTPSSVLSYPRQQRSMLKPEAMPPPAATRALTDEMPTAMINASARPPADVAASRRTELA
jgi:hypothetical protein